MSFWPDTFPQKDIHRLIFTFLEGCDIIRWIEDSVHDNELQCAIVDLYPKCENLPTTFTILKILIASGNLKALDGFKTLSSWVAEQDDWEFYATNALSNVFAVVMEHETTLLSRQLLDKMCYNPFMDFAKQMPFQTAKRLCEMIEMDSESKTRIIEDACNANNTRLLHLVLNQLHWDACFSGTIPYFSKSIVWPIVHPHILSGRIKFKNIRIASLSKLTSCVLANLVSMGALTCATLFEEDMEQEFVDLFRDPDVIHVANFLWHSDFEPSVLKIIDNWMTEITSKSQTCYYYYAKHIYDLFDQITSKPTRIAPTLQSACLRGFESVIRRQSFDDILCIFDHGAKLGRCVLVRMMLQIFADNEMYCAKLRYNIILSLESKYSELGRKWMEFAWETVADQVLRKAIHLAQFAHTSNNYKLWNFLYDKHLVTDDVLCDIAFHYWNKNTRCQFAQRARKELQSWPIIRLKDLYCDMINERNFQIARFLRRLQPNMCTEKLVDDVASYREDSCDADSSDADSSDNSNNEK